MSSSESLAVSITIGTPDSARMIRQTSIPDSSGSIRSRRTRSGRSARKRTSASRPSAADTTRNPSASSASTSASRRVGSSSTTRIVRAICRSGYRRVLTGHSRPAVPVDRSMTRAQLLRQLHEVLDELDALAVAVEAQQEVVVVERLGTSRPGSCTGSGRWRRRARRRTPTRRSGRSTCPGSSLFGQPVRDDRLATDDRVRPRLVAVLGLLGEQRRRSPRGRSDSTPRCSGRARPGHRCGSSVLPGSHASASRWIA